MEYSFYPGCALHSGAKEFDLSTRFVCQTLGVELKELSGWTCCGASSAHYVNHDLSLALPARNLMLASENGRCIVTSCSLCYNRLKQTSKALEKDRRIKAKLKELAGISYLFEVKVKNILEILIEDIGVDKIKEKKRISLNNLKVACYYGCLLTRPKEICSFDSCEHPTSMESILEALGAKTVKWSYKTECCGADLSLPELDIVLRLTSKLIEMAKEAGAQCMVTACPLCQANLELRQEEAGKQFGFTPDFPILYYSELIGISLGSKDALRWLNMHVVSPVMLLKNYGII